MTEHLELDDLLAAAEAALGHRPTVRDAGLLEAAVARTRATVYGEDAYPGLHAKAAALLHSLVTGHALVDGNKRLGWVACRLFYRLNGADLRMPEDEAYHLVVAVADGSIRDVPVIAGRIERFVLPIDADEVLGRADLELPPEWGRTAWGGQMPDVVAAVRRSRQGP